jgi:molybdopterin molybdotransferase
MIPVEKALQIILDSTSVLEPVLVPILDARGKVLAEDLVSTENIPAFDYALMSGYALRSNDTLGSCANSPAEIHIDGELYPGQQWPEPLAHKHAIKIYSGAPVPIDSDSVLVEEHVVRQTNGKALIYHPAQPGDNIRLRGEDIGKGMLVLPKGKKINASDIGMISALGLAEIKCFRTPRVSFLMTGSALAENCGPLPTGTMRPSNRFLLHSQIEEYGAQPIDLGIATNEREIVTQKIIEGLEYDMFISAVGPAIEDFGYVKKLLEKLGMDIKFWKVAIKPGKPLIFGTIGNVPIFGLTGHPFSFSVVLEQFVRPALMKMMGMESIRRTEVNATLTKDIRGDDGVTAYMRGLVTIGDSGFMVTPALKKTNSVRALSHVNGFIIIPPNAGYLKTGERVKVQIIADPQSEN